MTKTKRSVKEDDLKVRQRRGVQSGLLDARLAYQDAESIRRYVEPMAKAERVFPNHLPTQASGRWSTTSPPLVNFTKDIRDTVCPDPGWRWICWDWDGIEAVLAAIFSEDEDDLNHIRQRHDLHTITACDALRISRPPRLDKHSIAGESCQDWRSQYGWQPDDWRRYAFKTARYALAYSLEVAAILEARGAMDVVAEIARANDCSESDAKRKLIAIGQAYLASKPRLMAWKHRVMEESARTGISRTFLGRRRLLYGQPRDRMKQGLNHRAQGAVADIMNLTIIQIVRRWPDAVLVVNRHDGCEFAFPVTTPDPLPEMRQIVEREWDVDGTKHAFSASWHVVEAAA